MSAIIFDHTVTGHTARVVPSAIRTAPRALLAATLAALRIVGSAVRRWWSERTGTLALGRLDDATLRDLGIARSDAERVVKLGRP